MFGVVQSESAPALAKGVFDPTLSPVDPTPGPAHSHYSSTLSTAPTSPPSVRISIRQSSPPKHTCPWTNPSATRPPLTGNHTVVHFPLSSWKPTPPSQAVQNHLHQLYRKPTSTFEPDSDDEDLDADLSDSDSDSDSDESDARSSPPSPLFDRLASFPLPPQAYLHPEPVFVDLAALRKPIAPLKGSQRVHKMVSARMHRRPARGTPADMLRRAVLEANGRRAEQAREEERWEASRRAFEEERSRGEIVLGAFDI